MRVVCPGSTSQLLPTGHPAPSSNIKRVNRGHGNPDRTGKRARLDQRDRDVKFSHVQEAKKKNDMKQKVHGRVKPRAFDINYVFVGNLESSITQDRLGTFFQDCGQITRITIRCSRGQAITAGVAVPLAVRSERDRQYATIEFKDSQSARNALAYHGRVLDDCQLVVSASAADLPEVHEIVSTHMKRLREIAAWPAPRNKFKEPARSLSAKDTERFIDFNQPDNDRFHWLGMSFAKVIA